MINELITLNVNGYVLKARIPEQTLNAPVLFLLHGWTGNENAMWVFASKIPEDFLLVAPRGPFPTQIRGYGWTEKHPDDRLWNVDDFTVGVNQIEELVDELPEHFPVDFSSYHLIGFSQGAALAYTIALLQPENVSSLACLAGFLPSDASNYLPGNHLNGLRVFISHGTKDQIVPVERGRNAVRELQNAGADVTYCEDDVGHKLSASCFHGIEHFYKEI